MTFGERLVRLRNQKGLSQDALAESLGVSRQSVSKWETDASVPELDKLVKLSDLFEVSLDELVRGRSVSPVPPQAAPSFSLWERAAALYREKAWLSGWLLVAWGISGLLCSIWNAVVLYLPVGGLMGMLNLLFIALLPTHLENLLKMLLGALAVLYGKRAAGNLRWYHAGWALVAMGLFGFPVAPLKTGLLRFLGSLLYFFWVPQSPEELMIYWVHGLSEISGCILLCVAGLFMLLLGRKKSPE
ncbi:helix-turn-helix domain-containing protein [uncultured Dysosmobacter sp.]|uniref:helix-turn-helix domain-containing protein n=1 Tax=uncultured Dysosmobacter sp. TaxID=2591384 RepID=UPI002623FC80|nr:helix-turn-helix domain-containing protein [uncultured Dysosmobacter sp.]